MTKQEKAVITTALRWWESRRPVVYTVADHLQTPMVNIPESPGRCLALAVAALVRARREP